VRDQVVALRKHNLSIYDISRALAQAGAPLSADQVLAATPVADALFRRAYG
jgi:hypothetical protein